MEGIITACSAGSQSSIGVDLQLYIDSMPVPVIMLDQSGMIKTVNDEARVLFKKDLFYFKGSAPGKVFECEHAKSPEGCGNTVHCSGCAIRQAIAVTAATGEEIINKGATLNRKSSNNLHEIHLLITTKKLGQTVILKIENFRDLGHNL